ncbi:hypothetical protein HDU98_009089 [Podochytrium sp. JEL0797]|nr:hypothetical protein HDU98_009089 [Podochytrium sp. JEL0797]
MNRGCDGVVGTRARIAATAEDSPSDERTPLLNFTRDCDGLDTQLSRDPDLSIFMHVFTETPGWVRWTPAVCLAILVATSGVKYSLMRGYGVREVGFNSFVSYGFWIASSVLALFVAISSACVTTLAGPASTVSTSLFSGLHLIVSWFDVYTIVDVSGTLEGYIGWIDATQMTALGVLIGVNLIREYLETRKKVEALETFKMEHRTSLELHANLFSHLTFSWITPIVHMACKATLQAQDVWQIRKCDSTAAVLAKYIRHKHHPTTLFSRPVNSETDVPRETTVEELGRSSTRSVTWALARTVFPFAILQLSIASVTVVLQFSGPYFINRILTAFASMPENPTPAELLLPLTFILGLYVCQFVSAVLHGQQFFVGRRQSSHARSVLMAEIYAKSLRRGVGSGRGCGVEEEEGVEKENASTGKIISLLSVDVEKIREYLSYIYNLVLYFPVSLLISVGSLMYIMGVFPTLCGVSVMIVMGPLNYLAGKWLKRAQERLSKATDRRINATNEVLHGIRILKYLSWEDKFNQSITELRTLELRQLFCVSMNQLWFNTTSMASGLLVSFIIFSVHAMRSKNGTMDPATAFTGLYLVQQFMDILSRLPNDLMFFFQAKVAMARILQFLGEEEVEGGFNSDVNESTTPCIRFENASFTYHTASTTTLHPSSHFQLSNITLQIKPNTLNVICGPTGSGKTSLCLALLGELTLTTGTFHTYSNTIAYAAQTPWLLNATVRENILMGTEYDAGRYRRVLQATCLVQDLETWEGGDSMEIGEKGVNVSGGQKARIGLARALYSRAAVVVLDDPLSAVDASTARKLVRDAVGGELVKGRTVVLVTHAVALVLPVAGFVVVMKAGEVVASGSAGEVAKNPEVVDVHERMLVGDGERGVKKRCVSKMPSAVDVTTKQTDVLLVQKETMASGNVGVKVYGAYLKSAGGFWFGMLFFASFWLTIGVQFGNDFWLKKWSEAGKTGKNPDVDTTFFSEIQLDSMLISTMQPWSNSVIRGVTDIWHAAKYHTPRQVLHFQRESSIEGISVLSNPDVIYFITVYGLLGLGLILANNLNSFISIICSLKASRTMHRNLMNAMLGAPLRFFEVTPIGRILNRFSKDMSVVDQNVMMALRFFLNRVFVGLTVMFVISSGSLYFVAAVIPIAMVSMHIGKMYLAASRELKRLESVSRSPIYNQFSETLAGVTTIRAFRQTNRFLLQNSFKIDTNHRFFYTLWAANRWLCIRTDMISATVVLCSGLTVVFGHSHISKGWAGIILLYSGKFSDALVWIMRMYAELEMSLDSVERVVEYSEVQQEPARVNEDYRPDANVTTCLSETLVYI